MEEDKIEQIEFGKFDYHIMCHTEEDYTLTLSTNVEKSMMTKFLDMGLNRFKKVDSKTKKRIFGLVEEFEATPEMLPKLNKILKKQIMFIARDFEDDGVKLITHEVISGKYYQKRNHWNIQFAVVGKYAQH